MSRRILNLNDEELPLLRGKIGTIDIQEGCIEDCLVCGADAGKYKGSMEWELFERISDGLLEAKAAGHDLLTDIIHPFHGSEPAHYHSFSRGVERTLFDVVKILADVHDKDVVITTSGWKPGDNYQSSAMCSIVSAMIAEKERRLQVAREKRTPDQRFRVQLFYSLKTVGALARADYLKFVKNVLGTTDAQIINSNIAKLEDNIDEFFNNSRYIMRVKENFDILNHSDAKVLIQYIKEPESLPEHYKVFQYLFSEEFVKNIFRYCNPRRLSPAESRAFGGIGRAVTELGIRPASEYKEKNSVINGNVSSLSRYYGYSLKISSTGEIYVVHSFGTTDVYAPSLTTDLLLSRAESFERSSTAVDFYLALANVHGRKLLRE